jgi:ribosomal protein L24
MLQNSVRLFTVAGIEVGIHASWLIIFLLVTWTLAVGYFPEVIPGIEPATAWVLGVLASLLLFVSVLIHELAHSFMAKARGLDARSITLFLFGGVSNLGGEAKQPSVEFQVAIVGPLTSFALAGVAYLLMGLTAGEARLEAVFAYLTVINILLGAFNLVPGFPLDGGRVFRAIAWTVTGSLRRGTEIATAVGRVVGYGFMLLGIFLILSGEFLQGIWIAAIGWFLQSAAGASMQQVAFEQRLRNVRVGEVVRRDTTAASPNDSVAEVISGYLLRGNRRAVPVVRDGSVIGIITTGDIGKVLKVLPEENRVILEGINKIKRHTKPNQQNQGGGIIEKEAPFHASNVMLLTQDNRPTRVGYQISIVEAAESKKKRVKVRIARRTGEEI